MSFGLDYNKIIEVTGRARFDKPKPSGLKTLGASLALGIENTPLHSALSFMELQNAKNRSKEFLDGPSIDLEFPRLKGRFKTPQGRKFLELANQREQRRSILKGIQKEGNSDPLSFSNFPFKTANFAAETVFHITDPFNAFAGIAIGSAGVAKVVGAKLAASAFKAPITKQITANIVGDVLVESTVVNARRAQESLDISISQTLANSVIGGTLFPIGVKGVQLLGPLTKKFGTNFTGAVSDFVGKQLDRGKRIDIDPVIQKAQKVEVEDLNKRLIKLNGQEATEAVTKEISDITDRLREIDVSGIKLDEPKTILADNSPETNSHYDAKADDILNAKINNINQDKVLEHQELMKERIDLLDDAVESGILENKELIDEIVELKSDLSRSKLLESSTDLLINCVGNNG